MTKKRFTLQESDIYNRNDVIHDKGTEMPQSTVCDLLNEQEERIKKLKETIIKITHSYHQKHDNTIVNLVDEVYEENIGDLFIEWNHGDVDD